MGWRARLRHRPRPRRVALRTCAEPKVVTWDPPRGKAFWWFPYDRALARTVRAVAHLRSTRDADREQALKHGSAALAKVAGRWVRTLRSGR